MLKRIVRNGVKTAVVLSVTTPIAMMAASRRETGNPWSAINAICHIVDGDDVAPVDGFRPRESLLGLALNASAMVFWGLLYESALALSGTRSGAVSGVTATAAAYVVDYHVVPPRLTPGIEKRLSGTGILATYIAMAITLGASGLWNSDTGSDDARDI
jgi:hypothetical protein